MKRKATAFWLGTGKEGSGHVSTQSNVLNKAQYSYKSRFEDGIGTNPEELVAAAHAGCFTMKLSFLLDGAGFPPTSIETNCEVTLDNGAITLSHLSTKAKVPAISKEKFEEIAADAKTNCPVSKSLCATITLATELIS